MDYVEWQDFIKFLRVLLDENLNCKEQIKYTENKIAKNLQDRPLKVNSQQRHELRIIFNKNKFAHTREIFKEQKF